MEKKTKLQSGRSLSQTIESIMRESLKQTLYQNALEEKGKQRALAEEDDDLFGDDESDESSKKDKPSVASKTMDDEKEKLKKGNVEADDIIEKLNAIRAGRSFKDEDIAKKLDEYVNSLTKAEKVALFAFLKGISQMVTGEIEVDAAMDPGDPEPDVKMKKGEHSKHKEIKPNIIKSPPKEKAEKKPSSEDTSGPVPITPKKK